MPVADSSFLVAFFDRSDAHHESARKSFTVAEHVVITTETLIETLGVLKVKAGRSTATAALEDLIMIENIGWEENCDLMAAYRLYQRKKMRSIADALVINQCLRLDTDLLTYDEQQYKILKQLQS